MQNDQTNIGGQTFLPKSFFLFLIKLNTYQKILIVFIDFPPPPEFPNFMHHTLVQKYIELYAQKFGLNHYVKFNSEVSKVCSRVLTLYYKSIKSPKDSLLVHQLQVRRSEDDKWSVTLSDETVEFFDRIMLCTGHHCIPNKPVIKG